MKKVLLGLFMAMSALAAFADTPLVEQPPIEFDPIPAEAVAKLIPAAVAGRGWITRQTAPGHIEAKIDRTKFWVAVDIAYTDRNVTITYAGSENFNYREAMGGQPTMIHNKYINWTRNMAADIRRAILTYQASALPAPVATPAPVTTKALDE
ncbi:hypothetical protein [Chitiniphilus eburneus]|uniref:Lipoprotein n=1 Tax=Chitiniphilus eburneus TaxID=2571148 RepID=A0A4V5MR89_9NEIS|nr:hypothetical protein [Chitiniphilus eburneus]TJZ75528.1 hypothetical protein FAZ21_06330 [Chitiniphilus eburneus]